MKIIIAPNSFKESLSAVKVAEHLKIGFLRGIPDAQIICQPIADGGDGTLDALASLSGTQIMQETVTGPLGNRVSAEWAIIKNGKTAVIEMAGASGLILVPPDARNPMITSTYGTGQLISAAIKKGIKKIIIGIGGSATVDGGMGMLCALGVDFCDNRGNKLKGGGSDLGKIHTIDTSKLNDIIHDVRFMAACDVTSPLIGEHGAARVFAPQKGASAQMVETLEANMVHYAGKIKEFLGINISYTAGAGAAGGLGAALMAFLQAEFKKGIDLILDMLNFKQTLKGASLLITGEGRLDSQTMAGKAPMGAASIAYNMGIPVIGIAGSVSDDAHILLAHGFSAMFSLVNTPMSLKEAMQNTPALLENIAEQIARTIKQGADIGATSGSSSVP